MSDQEIRRYEQMLADDPKSRAFAPLAEAYRKAGRLDDAIKVAETGIRYHPDYSGGLVVLGRTLFEKGELARASEIITKAVKEAPDNYMAQKILAKVSMAQGEDASALKALEAARILSPGDMEVEEALERLHGKISHPGGIDFAPETDTERRSEDSSGQETQSVEAASAAALTKEDQLPPLEEGIQADGEDEGDLAELFHGDLTELSTDIGDLEEPPDLSRTGGDSAPPGAGEQVPPFVSDLSSLSEGDPAEGDLDNIFLSDQAVEEAVSEVDETMDAIMPSAEEAVPVTGKTVQEPVSGDTGSAGEEDISTETLADLYAQQGLRDKAAQIYRMLQEDRPDDPVLREKLRRVDLMEDGGKPAASALGDESAVPEVPDTPVSPVLEVMPQSPEAAKESDTGAVSAPAGDGEDSSTEVITDTSLSRRDPEPIEVLEKWLKNAERMRRR